VSIEQQFDCAFAREQAPLPADVDRARLTVARIPAPVRTLLDVGCGTGVVTRLAAQTIEVTAVELSGVGVEKVRALGIACRQGSIADLPFPDRHFDLVMANEVIEHLDQATYAQGIRELSRVAREFILLTVPNRDHLPSLRHRCPRCATLAVPWGHLRSFDLAGLATLIPGFRLTRAEAFGPRIPDRSHPLTRGLSLARNLHNPLRRDMRCPVCGYVETGPADRRPRPTDLLLHPGLVVRYVADMLPVVLGPKCPRWLLGLYERAAPPQPVPICPHPD
jgi:SAM-dependent methyltransferase